ncbi:hypothetical protein [Streptomyces sp. 7N604]|uniref:hypothetical protein n=1 Tax=Streptomyces sp. 7N604 TaxID=3457415 RepID=UPI003FD1DADD
MPNAELAARILHEITERPQHHDQSYWIDGVDVLLPTDDLTTGTLDCGTTLCVAGFAAHLTDYTVVFDADLLVVAHKPGHSATLVDHVARAELGLTASDAAWLFEARRTPAEVHNALSQLAAGANAIDRPAA